MVSRLQEMEARLAPLKVKVDHREAGFVESRLQEMEARLAPLKVKVDQREAGFVESRLQVVEATANSQPPNYSGAWRPVGDGSMMTD